MGMQSIALSFFMCFCDIIKKHGNIQEYTQVKIKIEFDAIGDSL